MHKNFATLDIGSSQIKAMIWDPYGQPIFYSVEQSPPLEFRDQAVEQNVEAFYEKILLSLQKLSAVTSLQECACLALSTQRNTLIALDANKKALTPIISWLDNRGQEVGGNRFNWFEKVFSDCKKIVYIRSLMSWLVEKFTQQACETASTTPNEWLTATGKVAFNGPELVSSGTLLFAHPLEERLLPILAVGLPIIIGPGDKDCALLGGQSYMPHQAVLCTGTAISLGKLIKSVSPLPKQDNLYLSPTDFNKHFPVEAGLPFGGGLLQWLRETYPLQTSSPQSAPPKKNSTLFCLPSALTYKQNGSITPSFKGLTALANAKTVVNAVLEGIILALMQCKLALESFSGESIKTIVLGGNNRLLIQQSEWLADALNCEIKPAKKLRTNFLRACYHY